MTEPLFLVTGASDKAGAAVVAKIAAAAACRRFGYLAVGARHSACAERAAHKAPSRGEQMR